MTDDAPVSPSELREKAQRHGQDALEKLKALMVDEGSSKAIQLSAARAILERGYGRPASLREEDDDQAPITVVVRRFTDARRLEEECENPSS